MYVKALETFGAFHISEYPTYFLYVYAAIVVMQTIWYGNNYGMASNYIFKSKIACNTNKQKIQNVRRLHIEYL